MFQKMPQKTRFITKTAPSEVIYTWSSNTNPDSIICNIPMEHGPFSKSHINQPHLSSSTNLPLPSFRYRHTIPVGKKLRKEALFKFKAYI